MVERLRIGVIGAGRIAEKHLEVLRSFEDVDVVALANRGHPRGEMLARRFSISVVYSDYRSLLDGVQLDAVFVLVSVLDVARVGADCLERGVPTLLENPPGLAAAETRHLLTVTTASGATCMVGLNRRFYVVIQRTHAEVSRAGRLVGVTVDAPERLQEAREIGHPAEVVERFIVANGIHCIDLLRFFVGDIVSLHTTQRDWRSGTEKSYGALMAFASGAIGQYIGHRS